MKRRAVLAGAGSVLAGGSAGCPMLSADDSEAFRLWFVRILNGSTKSENVWLRVRRDSTAVHEVRFESIPSFRDVEQPEQEPTFANEPNIRFITDEWEPRSASYEIEYRFEVNATWETLELGDVEVGNVGVDLQIMPGRESIGAGGRVVEFESRDAVDRFFHSIENETGNATEREP